MKNFWRHSLLSFFLLFTAGSPAHAETQFGLLFPDPDVTVLELLAREDVANSDSYWISLGAGGSIYEARQGLFLPRWSPGVQVGRRFGRFGAFLHLEFDQSFDFTQETKNLNVYHVGAGVENLALYGRIRSSASAGIAILGTETDFDERGTIGWYADIRPVAVRWRIFNNQVLELAPLTVDLSIPVARGIPLILFSYFTMLSIEWAEGPIVTVPK